MAAPAQPEFTTEALADLLAAELPEVETATPADVEIAPLGFASALPPGLTTGATANPPNLARSPLGTAFVVPPTITNTFQPQPNASGTGGSVVRINDGITTGTIHDATWNGHGAASGSASILEIRWDTPQNIASTRILWGHDGGGVQPPASATLSWWNGTAFVPVTNAVSENAVDAGTPRPGGNSIGTTIPGGGTLPTAAHTHWNAVSFDPIVTTILRVTTVNGTNGPGIYQWEVFQTQNLAMIDLNSISADFFMNLFNDVTIPTGVALPNGSTVTAVSSNDAVLSNTGVITRGSATVTGTITLTAVNGTDTYERTFAFSVLREMINAQAPVITTQPEATVTINGTNPTTTLSVVATEPDFGTLSYQWYADGTPIPSATESTFTVPTGTAGTVNYHVVVTNTDLSATNTTTATTASQTSAVTVELSVVSVTINPTSRVIRYGGSFQFNANVVTVGGAPTGVNWTIARVDSEQLALGTEVVGGLVTIAEAEELGELVLTATATHPDGNRVGTARVVVTDRDGQRSPNVFWNTFQHNPNTGAVLEAGANAAIMSANFEFIGGTAWPLITGTAGTFGPATGYARNIFPAGGAQTTALVFAPVANSNFSPGNIMRLQPSGLFMGRNAAGNANFAIYRGNSGTATAAGNNTPNIDFGNEFLDVEIHAGTRVGAAGNTGDFVFRFQDVNNFYFLRARAGETFQIGQVLNGTETILQTGAAGTGNSMPTGTGAASWVNLRLTIQTDDQGVSRLFLSRMGTIIARANSQWATVGGGINGFVLPTAELNVPGQVGFRTTGTAARWNHVQIASFDTQATLVSPNGMFRMETGANGNIQSINVLQGRNWGFLQRNQHITSNPDNTPVATGLGTARPVELLQNDRIQSVMGGRHRSLGDLRFNYRLGDAGAWLTASTGNSGDNRMIWQTETVVGVDYTTPSANVRDGIRDFAVEQEFGVGYCPRSGDYIRFEFTVTNTNATQPLTIRDLSLPVTWNHHLFGSNSGGTPADAYTHWLAPPRTSVANHGSYIMLERMDGASSNVVLIPDVTTNAQFEYRRYHMFAHDNYSTNMMEEFFIYSQGVSRSHGTGAGDTTNGNLDQSYLPNTQLVLGPNESSTYGFKMFHINDYVDLQALLYDQGLLSTIINPGTVTFMDQEAKVAVYNPSGTKLTIADFTDITPLPSTQWQGIGGGSGNEMTGTSGATWFTEGNRNEWTPIFRHIEDRCDESCANCGNDAIACTGRLIQVFGITFQKLGRNDIQITWDYNGEERHTALQFWLQLPLGNEINMDPDHATLELGEVITPGVLQTHSDFIMDYLWVSPQMQTDRFGAGVTDTALLPNTGHSGTGYRDHLSNFVRDHRYSFLKLQNTTGRPRTGTGNGFACNNTDYEQYNTVAQFLLEKNISMPIEREVQALEMNLIHMTYAKNVQPFGGYVDSARTRTDEFRADNPFGNPVRLAPLTDHGGGQVYAGHGGITMNAIRTPSNNTYREGAISVKCCWQVNGFRMGGNSMTGGFDSGAARGIMQTHDRVYNHLHMANQFFSMYQILRNNPHVNDWLGPNNQFVNDPLSGRANNPILRTWDHDTDVQWCAVDFLRVAGKIAVESTTGMRGFGKMGEQILPEIHAALLYEYVQGNHGTFTKFNPCAAMQPLMGGGHTVPANQGELATSNRMIAARIRGGLGAHSGTGAVAQAVLNDGLTPALTSLPAAPFSGTNVQGASGIVSKANGFSLTNPYGSEFWVDNTSEEGVYFITLGFGTPDAFGRTGNTAGNDRWNPDSTHAQYFRHPDTWSLPARVVDKVMGWTGMVPQWYLQHTSRPMGSDWWNFQYTVGMQGAVLQHWFFNFEEQDRTDAMWHQLYGHSIAPFVGIMTGQPEIQIGPTSQAAGMVAAGQPGVPQNADPTRQGRGPIGSMWFINTPNRPYNFAPGIHSMYAQTGEGGLKLWAGLRILHTAVVPNDVHFGLTAYGGTVQLVEDGTIAHAAAGETFDYWEVVPQDGLQRRLNIVDGRQFQAQTRSHQYARARICTDLTFAEFELENVWGTAGQGSISVRNLTPGEYFVFVDGVVARESVTVTNENRDRNNLTLPYVFDFNATAELLQSVLIIRTDLVEDFIAVLGDGVAYEMTPADDADAHDYNVTVSPGADEITVFVAAYNATTVTITGADGTGSDQPLVRGLNVVTVTVYRAGETTTTVLHIYRPYGVRFDGMTDVTLEVNRGDGWVTYGPFDHYALLSDITAGTQVRGIVATPARIVSTTVTADGSDEVALPVGEVVVTGIAIPGLNVRVQHANNATHGNGPLLYHAQDHQATGFSFHTWDIAGEEQMFCVQLNGLGFQGPRFWFTGFEIDLSGYFYEVTIPDSVTGVAVRNAGGAVINGINNRNDGSFWLINTGLPGTLTFTFNNVERTIDIIFDGNCPFGLITVVRFGGMAGVTLQTNEGPHNAWVTDSDAYADYAVLIGLAPDTRIRGLITAPARIESLEVRSTDAFDILYLPVSEVVVSGIAISGLNVDIRRANNDEHVNGTLLHRGPHAGGDIRFNTFATALGAEQLFMVQFGGNLGFNALQRFFDDHSIDLDYYFYDVVVPAGFSNVAIRNAVNAALHGRANFAANDPITLIRTGQPVDLIFTYCCLRGERISFYLDGSNPFTDIICCTYTLTLENFSPAGMEQQVRTHDLYPNAVLSPIENGFGVNEHGGLLRGGEVIDSYGWVRSFQLTDWVVYSPEGFELGGTAWFNRSVTMLRGDVTLRGDWQQHGGRYAIVVFDANSGAFDDEETSYETRSRVHEYWAGGDRPYSNIRTLSALAPTAPEKEGYVFLGWALTPDAEEVLPGDFIVDTPGTFYAVWVEDGAVYHAITWALADGAWADGFTPPATVLDGETLDIAEADEPTREGFTFTGWNPALPTTVTEPITVTAQWEAEPVYHAITWALADGAWAEGFTPPATVLDGETLDIAEADEPTREGFTFTGWSPTLPTTVTEAITVTAQWEAEPVYHAITWALAGGAWADGFTPPATVLDGETLDVAESDEPTREGFTFTGWSPTLPTTVTEPITVTAQWEAEPVYHAITWALAGGAWADGFTPPATVLDGETLDIAESDEPTREGFTFTGWNPTLPTTVTEPITVTAQWEAEPVYHAITWALAGGAWAEGFTPPATVLDGETLDIAEADEPTREDFIFTGWNPVLPTTVTEPITVTAQWIRDDAMMFTIDRVYGAYGERVAVDVFVENNKGIHFIHMFLEYDSARIRLVEDEFGIGILSTWSSFGPYQIVSLHMPHPPIWNATGDGRLVTLFFDIVAYEEGPVPITITSSIVYYMDSVTLGTYSVENRTVPGRVTITTSVPVVESIAVTTQPTTLVYTEGDTLDLSGLVVTLTYDNGDSRTVAFADFAENGLTVAPAAGTVLESTHDGTVVTITHTASEETATTDNLTVNAPVVASIAVTAQPETLVYTEGELLNLSGLVVTLTYNNGTTRTVAFADFVANGLTASPAAGTSLLWADNDDPVTITHTASGTTAMTDALTVNIRWGDVNNDGSVTMDDVALLQQYILGEPVDGTWMYRGDVNHDGALTLGDVSLLNLYVLGFPVRITPPVTTAAVATRALLVANTGEVVVTATVRGETPVVPGAEILVDFALTETPELGIGLLQMELTTEDLTILGTVWEDSSHLPRFGPTPRVSDDGSRVVLGFHAGTDAYGNVNVVGTGDLVTVRFLVPADAAMGEVLTFDIAFVESSCYATGDLPGLVSTPIPAELDGGMVTVTDSDTEIEDEPQPEADEDEEIADSAREFHLAYMLGNTAGEFEPRANITRAQVAAILARTMLEDFVADALPEDMDSFDAFEDVASSNWFYYYVAWAYEAGLVEGDGRGNFLPNDPITREQLAAMLARTGAYAAEAGEMPFLDVDTISGWAAHLVYTTFTEGWMVGDTQGDFRPRANISRAEVATAVNRILGRIDSRAALEALEELDIADARNFPDVADDAWYFASVLGATNDHYLTRGDGEVISGKAIVVQ